MTPPPTWVRVATPRPAGTPTPAAGTATPSAAPAADGATPPTTNTTATTPATDTREPADRARAEATAAKLTGQCVRDVAGATVLTAPRTNRGGQPAALDLTAPSTGANACSSLAPVIAGINAAQDTPLSPSDVGAATAVSRVSNSTVTAETERLLAQPNTRTAVVVSGNYDEAAATIRGMLQSSEARLAKQYPAMVTLQRQIFADLQKAAGNRPIDVEALRAASIDLTVRAITSLNGIRPGTNVPGERTIAFPNAEARLAMIPTIVDQIIQNPTLLPADVREWVKANVGSFTERAQAIRQVQRAMHDSLEAGAITELIASGRLPVNLTPDEYRAELAKIRGNAINELKAARPFTSPQERTQAFAVMDQGAAEARERPPVVSFERYRQIGARAAELTLRGEAHATVYNAETRSVQAVTAQNYQYALTERRADASSAAGATEPLPAGTRFFAEGEQRRQRERDEQLRPGAVARQTAALSREVAAADRLRVTAARTEAQNRRTSFVNLRDPGSLTLAAFAARSGNRVS